MANPKRKHEEKKARKVKEDIVRRKEMVIRRAIYHLWGIPGGPWEATRYLHSRRN